MTMYLIRLEREVALVDQSIGWLVVGDSPNFCDDPDLVETVRNETKDGDEVVMDPVVLHCGRCKNKLGSFKLVKSLEGNFSL